MKKIKSLSLIFVVLVLILSACQKSEDPMDGSGKYTGYDEIINSLTTGQAYALVESLFHNPILLVADGVYDYDDGVMAAIDAEVYVKNNHGDTVLAGNIQCDGTAYPIATTDQFIWMSGGHHISKLYIDESTNELILSIEATETFDSEGNATYRYYSAEDNIDGTVEDDRLFLSLFEEYTSHGNIIDFTVIN